MKSLPELEFGCLESTLVSNANLLSIKSLSVSFGGLKALSNVNLDLNENEVVGLIGPNGAGKTTLFNSISGLVDVDSGTLEVNSKLHKWPKPFQLVDLGISRTLQGVGLFPELTVLENVMIGDTKNATSGLVSSALGLSGRAEAKLKQRAMTALERVYASGISDKRADSLPYPVTKRVAIARALVSEPKILLLDEPAGGLGALDIEWMNSLIHNLATQCSVILVEHHMDVVMSVCDRLYVLNFGIFRSKQLTLIVEGLTIDHGAIRAISNVSFKVPQGQLAAIIGSNGAGKTTLLRTLSGLKKATSGSATWDGHSILDKRTEDLARSGIVHVSDGKSVIAELTVKDNLALPGIWRKDKKDVASATTEVIEMFPILGQRLSQSAGSLSGGERQMLAIGRALIARPKLLLLDEPSLGLAPLIVEQIFQTIKLLVTKMDLTVVLVEQNAMGALKIANEGIVLNLGSVVAVDSANKLLSDPALRAAYLGF